MRVPERLHFELLRVMGYETPDNLDRMACITDHERRVMEHQRRGRGRPQTLKPEEKKENFRISLTPDQREFCGKHGGVTAFCRPFIIKAMAQEKRRSKSNANNEGD